MNLLRTFHTVRHLRGEQVRARVCRPLVPRQTLPPAVETHRLHARSASAPAAPRDGGYDGQSFAFLNRRLSCNSADRWSPSGASHLWLYNLHYFHYIWNLEPTASLQLILDWITRNGGDLSGVGWEAYPLSLRIREWVEWVLANGEVDSQAQSRIVASITQQVTALSRQVEYHIGGNHLLENAITLCWAGLSLVGPAADDWLQRGLPLLERELAGQVLGDGVHDERSPMYQALLVEALLRLAEVAKASTHRLKEKIAAAAQTAGRAMLSSLELFQHPDGDYALLNDAAFGVAPTRRQLLGRFGSSPTERPPSQGNESGYLVARSDDQYLVFDAAPLGPDHQPGHGHADALSFELSLHGRRVITDTGTYTYDPGPIRRADRATAGHNTIEIDGYDQSELWASFRCGRRVAIESIETSAPPLGPITLRGRYRGPRAVRHARNLTISGEGLRMVDAVEVRGPHVARSRLHFGPGIELRRTSGGWTVYDGHRPLLALESCLDWTPSTSPYHPEFGVEIERPVLTAVIPFSNQFDSSSTLRFL